MEQLYPRRETLTLLAQDQAPKVYYGPDRPAARDELITLLYGIEPTRSERMHAAFAGTTAHMTYPCRKVRAFDNGLTFLRDAYNTTITDFKDNQ